MPVLSEYFQIETNNQQQICVSMLRQRLAALSLKKGNVFRFVAN